MGMRMSVDSDSKKSYEELLAEIPTAEEYRRRTEKIIVYLIWPLCVVCVVLGAVIIVRMIWG